MKQRAVCDLYKYSITQSQEFLGAANGDRGKALKLAQLDVQENRIRLHVTPCSWVTMWSGKNHEEIWIARYRWRLICIH